MKVSCVNCKYSKVENINGEVKIICRRYPPVNIGTTKSFRQPVVNQYDWCGEYINETS